jgi:hypothetical protein
MGFIATVVGALSVWLVLWAIGAKSFDGFLVAIVIILAGISVLMIGKNLPGNREP